MRIKFDNQYVLSKLEKYKQEKDFGIVEELKRLLPSMTNSEIIQVYTMSISLRQSRVSGVGKLLEDDIVSELLETHDIPYKKQVTIDTQGVIVGFNQKKKKCYHVVDFVIGREIQIGESIEKYIVLSCKSSCRERWTQDSWSFTLPPKLYVLLTFSDDYPPPLRFRESTSRKIVTCRPKRKDEREFKLTFEDVVLELQERL